MSLVAPHKTTSLVHLIENSEIENEDRSYFLGACSNSLLRKLIKISEAEGDLLLKGFELIDQLFKGNLSVHLISVDNAGINKKLLANAILLSEKNLTQQLVKNAYNGLIQVSNASILNASRAVRNVFADFDKKYVDEKDDGINFKCFDNNFYIDEDYVLNSPLFNNEVSKMQVKYFQLETGTKRCVFIHNLFKPLVIDQNGEAFFRKHIVKQLSKSAVFLTFLEIKNLNLIDVKLKALEDPCFENQIREDFNDYVKKFPFLESKKKADPIEPVDKMAFALEALKAELEAVSAFSASCKKQKKTPQQKTPTKSPLQSSASVNQEPKTRPQQRDLLTTVRAISKQEALSPEWKKVEVAKKSVELSPSKAFQKIINNETTLSLKSRVLRWLTLESLDQVKQFQDMQSQSPAKKLVKRYEKMTSEELFTQVLRHAIPSCLLPVFASPDFRRLYCYQKDSCYYVKVRISMPSINFNEETIVSFAFNPQNQLYHFFIHPQNEIQFDKVLSDIPRSLDSTSEDLSTESLPDHLLEELTGVPLDGLNGLAILAKYKHPTNQHSLELCLIPRN